MKGLDLQEMLFWIIVAVIIVLFMVLFANELIFGYLDVTNIIEP
ncbi:MAG: hypothetical protein ABIE55_04510 [Candidatus Aenigmatarchaeota archaeon]